VKQIKYWLTNARPVSLPQSMMPALVAVFLSTKYSDFRWYLALISLIGVAFAHLSLNLFDDYFDFKNAKQGDRSALAREGFRAQTYKCPDLQSGAVSPKQWLCACIVFGAIACACGLPVLIIRGIRILWIVLAVGILGLFYSAPPLKLGYHGLGELLIGCIFGPALGIGMSIAASGEFHASEVLISIAWGLLVVNILYVHSIMDYASDQKAGKKTLAWLLSSKRKGLESNSKAMYIALAIINFVPYVLVILGVVFKAVSPLFLIALLALPWSIELFRSMLEFKRNPFGKVTKKWWYGKLMLWDEAKKAGVEWFALRWLLAQKTDTAFSILCIIAAIVQLIIK